MANISEALGMARTLLNDDNGLHWTDAMLLPKAIFAHKELQTDLWEVGSPVVREESGLLSVGIGAIDLGESQPSNMLAPTRLYEYSNADVFVGEMTEVFYMPKGVAPTTKLIYWSWRKEVLTFLGATVATKVQIQYRKLITVPTEVGSDIGILFGELYIGPRVAALAAGSVGNAEVMAAATAVAKENFAKVVRANRGQQKPMNRP